MLPGCFRGRPDHLALLSHLKVFFNLLLIASFFDVVTANSASEAGDSGKQDPIILYNGIKLASPWPPHLESLTRDPTVPPYLNVPPDVIPIDVGRQLFVDDFLIEHTTLKRIFHLAEPYQGNPILTPEKPWEYEGEWNGDRGPYTIPFSDGVWFDPRDGLLKMWYMAGLMNSTCYAISKDGIRWERPSLDIKPGTNIVLLANRDSSTIWFDADESDPTRRFKMFRFQKTPRRGLVIQFSPDGIHWSKEIAWAGPCLDRTTVFYNPFRKVWVYSIKDFGPVQGSKAPERLRRYWEQADLLSSPFWEETFWERSHLQSVIPFLWVTADRLDPLPEGSDLPNPQVYNLDAVAYESLMLGLFAIHQRSAQTDIGRPKLNEVFVGFSRDGFHWYRPFHEPFISVSPHPGDWNWGNVQSVGGGCLIMGEKIFFYYSGRAGTSRLGKEKSFFDADASTGLAFLRRDGFASMVADKVESGLTTRRLHFTGKYLFVNANVRDGELKAEILDDQGKVVAPFTKANCIPLRRDSTLQPVLWNGGKDLTRLSGRPIRLRFFVRNGSLYSFWVSPDPNGASYGYVAAGGPGFTGSRDTVGRDALEATHK